MQSCHDEALGAGACPVSYRPRAIELRSNRLLVHPIGDRLLPLAIRFGLSPNQVTLMGLAAGLAAALAFTRWQDPAFAVLGFLLMGVWHVLDGLDGALARATARTSPVGRLLDGVADHLVFVAVYVALAFSFAPPWGAVALASAAGAAHALQAAFYEAQRATWRRRAEGRLAPVTREAAGGPFEALYNRAETLLGNRATAFDQALAGASPQQRRERLAGWLDASAPVLRRLGLLSANGRTVAILVACLAFSPIWFWLWELVVLSLVAVWSWKRLRLLEQRMAAGL